jgi:hypothetical protein
MESQPIEPVIASEFAESTRHRRWSKRLAVVGSEHQIELLAKIISAQAGARPSL